MCAAGMENPLIVYKINIPEEGEEIMSGSIFEKVQTLDDSGSELTFVEWHSKANFLVAGSRDTLVWMWNVVNGEFTTFAGHSDAVNCGGFGPNGKQIVTASDDCSVKVWAPKTGECLRTIEKNSTSMFHEAPIGCLTFCGGKGIVTGD